MAKELPNFDISPFDFIWNDTTVDRQILFYKNAFKIKKKQSLQQKSKEEDQRFQYGRRAALLLMKRQLILVLVKINSEN